MKEKSMHKIIEKEFNNYRFGHEIKFFKKRIDFTFIDNQEKIHAIELKIKDWKSALDQIETNQLCANFCYLGIWHENKEYVSREILKKYGFGLISINKNKCRILLSPTESSIINKEYQDLSLNNEKNHKYFIDPVTYKFQYGGNRRFYMKYLDYFQELEELFNKENIINLDFFKDQNNFEDFYKKIIRFQRTMLAKTHIPLDYYKAIANGNKDVKSFNPIRNLEFFISPYFEFYKIGNEYYNLTLKYSLKNTKNYCILRFPKKILIDYNNLNKIVDDFRDSKGILLNILNLNEYDIGDLKLYFENLIDLIYKFSSRRKFEFYLYTRS
ncbi:MAG: hypothetical protein P8Y70_04130 [Candidatus Lokiarchaeota archaeon]